LLKDFESTEGQEDSTEDREAKAIQMESLFGAMHLLGGLKFGRADERAKCRKR
jgi:hypothetical protein